MSNRAAADIVSPAGLFSRGFAAVLAWCSGIAIALSLDDPRLRFPAFLAAVALATCSWLWIAHLARTRQLSRDAAAAAVFAALAARLISITLPPALSEDVFRHIYEGRVVWSMGLAFPFEHAPAAAELFGAPREVLDASWLRVNHAHVPTIYPPFAQLVFALGGKLGDLAGGAHLAIMKSLFVAAELAAIWAITRALEAREGTIEARREARSSGVVGVRNLAAPGRDGGLRAEALLLLMSPLAVLEIGREGHADSLAMLGLAIGIYAFVSLRPRLGFAGFALAALAKLNGLIAIAAVLRSSRRGALAAVPLLALIFVPFALAGTSALGGAGEYATAWRGGDGIFTPVLALAEVIVGGDWTHAGSLTITKHQLARAIDAILFFAFAAVLLRRRANDTELSQSAGLVLFALLLFAPALHPWYTLWLLPFAAVAGRGRSAMLAFIALSPLLHHPGWLELESGRWTDLGWVRALVHVPAWALLLRDLARPVRLS